MFSVAALLILVPAVLYSDGVARLDAGRPERPRRLAHVLAGGGELA
jgi:hypothetical protein